ncbi:unnamed protein product [Kuraishia capsulata CBS 1993]|uniref:RNA helicase n=1 Tax=Kuraishia capsulata CBS 1993 TaxID=1382522 RepID=W6MM93_9ASCO|nr:uncharacterized protein KUCA_T00003668001 [Kuraishia capsulata CBS 1993]CDK27689.1 unnamed protein product [Kuraishia capsulata CBS 1993]
MQRNAEQPLEGSRAIKKRKFVSIIPKSKWPPKFLELETIHFRLNSYFTFLSSRKHIVPTFELLKTAPETDLKRDITIEDFSRIVALLPSDVVFKYVDENQFMLEEKDVFNAQNQGFNQTEVDIYDIESYEKAESSKQLLIFEFIDGDVKKSKTKTLYRTEIKVPVYSAESMKKLINKRNSKFEVSVSQFLEKCASEGKEDAFAELTEISKQYIPEEEKFLDPVEEMVIQSQNPSQKSQRKCTISQFIQMLREEKEFYKNQIVRGGLVTVGATEAKYAELDFELQPELYQALTESKGISTFYSHQSQALNALEKGENVVVSTPTSSGKSLIYQIPVLNSLLLHRNSKAMFIFPTKALAQDQKRSLVDFLQHVDQLYDVVVETYDGDTDKAARDKVRESASVIFTNPDMLHTSILPNHRRWTSFLKELRYVVVDELHMYKSLFGSHVALIMRRLLRICTFLGNTSIRFVSCSATLRDPQMHMSKIFGLAPDTICHVSEDGSSSGEKQIVMWNPPLISPNDPTSGHENFVAETAKILVRMMDQNIRTIVFCVVRKVCELLMNEVRQLLTSMNRPDLKTQVMSYRGGYSPSDRRKIEFEMFSGNLKAIISTNALELGIDIGSLDAVVMCGFPLSVANFHQQSGRAGRRSNESMTLVVGGQDPVSQHYLNHPEELINTEMPDLPLDFDNVLVLEGHIQCAAFELTMSDWEWEKAFFGDYKSLEKLCKERLDYLEEVNGYTCNRRFLPWPSNHVSIRAIEQSSYAVVDITNGRNQVIEEIEASRTTFTLYDGGIFIHQGYPYLIKEFNPEQMYAKVERVNVDWTTSQRDFTDVDPVEIEMVRSLYGGSDVPVYFGKIESTSVVFGFFKVDRRGRILDAIEVNNPPVVVKSKGLWIDIPAEALEIIQEKKLSAAGGVHAAEHALMNVFPLFVVSSLGEVQSECKAPEKEFAKTESTRKRPARLIFYDAKAGQCGSGLSTKVFEHIDEVLKTALDTVQNCKNGCDWGCPDCVAASFCKENSLVLSKPAAIVILAKILGVELDLDSIPLGPEPNMPEIENESIVPASGVSIKFSDDLQIIDVRQASEPLKDSSPKAEEAVDDENPVVVKKEPAEAEEPDGFDDDDDDLFAML